MWRTGLVAPQHVGSSRTRDRTRVPCIGRRILNHCATREVLLVGFSGKGCRAFDGSLCLGSKVRPEVRALPGASAFNFKVFAPAGCCPPSRSPPRVGPAIRPWPRRPHPPSWSAKRARWTGPTTGAARKCASRCLRRIRRTRVMTP